MKQRIKLLKKHGQPDRQGHMKDRGEKGFKAFIMKDTVRRKLITSYLVPIAFIIILGIVSYEKAAQGMRDSYELSTGQMIYMTGQYLELGITSIEAISDQYLNDNEISEYYLGLYSSDVMEYSKKTKAIQNMIQTKATSDHFISQITILSDQVKSLSSKVTSFGDNIYGGFSGTKTGKELNQNPLKKIWCGSETYLDVKLGISSEQYRLCLTINNFINNKYII